MNACELLTKSERIALIVDSALRRDKHATKTSSKLVKGNTERGIKDFHLHRIYSEIPVEIMQNYHEYCSDNFPIMFSSASVVIQACPLEPSKAASVESA